MQEEQWFKTKEAQKLLGVSDCKLAHLRQDGKLRYTKQGNAYLYAAADCEKLCQQKP